MVFYFNPQIFLLPAGSQEKITLCISILVLLILFLILIIDFVPPNDEVLPFLGGLTLFRSSIKIISAGLPIEIEVLLNSSK